MDRNGNCFVDVDECFDGNHICPDDQICINTIGSYQCEWYENAAMRNGKNEMIFLTLQWTLQFCFQKTLLLLK